MHEHSAEIYVISNNFYNNKWTNRMAQKIINNKLLIKAAVILMQGPAAFK